MIDINDINDIIYELEDLYSYNENCTKTTGGIASVYIRDIQNKIESIQIKLYGIRNKLNMEN